MKMRLVLTFMVLGIMIGAVGYHLARANLQTVAAEPAQAGVKAPLSVQATTVEEVEARAAAGAISPPELFADDAFGYHLVYPLGWRVDRPAPNRVSFRAPDGTATVLVEAVGRLAADGLAGFTNRSLDNYIVLSRQSLVVHGLPAERVQAYSDKAGGQVTLFFIDAGQSGYVLTGTGEQKALEVIARSFNSPQPLALH